MVIINVTEEGDQITSLDRLCSTQYTGGIYNHLVFLSGLNIFFSITAFLQNSLILIALHKTTFLHPSSKVFLRCLATTDLCVGISSEPITVIYWISVLNERWDICRPVLFLAFITGYMLSVVSLLTLTAISVDRLLALLLALRYRQVVTLKRTYLVLTALWFVAIYNSTGYFWNTSMTYYFTQALVTLCLIASVLCYAKIFLNLRHQQTIVQPQHQQTRNSQERSRNQTVPTNMVRYRKAVASGVWLLVALVVCLLPYSVLEPIPNTGPSIFFVRQCALTLVYMNSSLNPILYYWKMRELRQAVKSTIRQFFC